MQGSGGRALKRQLVYNFEKRCVFNRRLKDTGEELTIEGRRKEGRGSCGSSSGSVYIQDSRFKDSNNFILPQEIHIWYITLKTENRDTLQDTKRQLNRSIQDAVLKVT